MSSMPSRLAIAGLFTSFASDAASGGVLSYLTVSGWSATITQVGGRSVTFSSSDPTGWNGTSGSSYVLASAPWQTPNPYGTVQALASHWSPAWDELGVAGHGALDGGPGVALTSILATFEIEILAAEGVALRGQFDLNRIDAVWSWRATTDPFGSGTVLTRGMNLGPGTYAIDLASTVDGSPFAYSTLHFAPSVPLPQAAGLALAGLVPSLGRRRRRGQGTVRPKPSVS